MFWIYLLLIVTAVAAGSLVFVIPRDSKLLLKLLLAFSGAFLIGISFLDLVPEVFSGGVKNAGFFVLAGFVLQLLLELLTRGAEHGHEHRDDCHGSGHVSPVLLLLGLCIHSFLEGMPIVSANDAELRNTLVTGIIIHNIPISLTLMSLFIHYGFSARKALALLLLFALMTPLGSLFSTMLKTMALTGVTNYFDYALAVVIGIFLHVSTSILFETSEDHQYNLKKFTTVLAGLATAYLVTMI